MRKDRDIFCDLHFVKEIIEAKMQIDIWETLFFALCMKVNSSKRFKLQDIICLGHRKYSSYIIIDKVQNRENF